VSLTLRDGLVIAAVIAGVLALMLVVRLVAGRLGINPEGKRKLIHVATGLASLSFPFLFDNPLPVLVLMSLAIALMLLLRLPQAAGLGAVLHDVKRPSWGEIYLALAIIIVFFHARGDAVSYVLPMLVITLSDTASALIGTSYGRRRFAVEDGTKSWEGVIAFFVVTVVVAMVTLLLLSDAPRPNVIILSLLIAAFCALVEADSWQGLDNLFVPVGAHLLLVQHIGSDPVTLIAEGFVFLVFLGTMRGFADALGISARAARGYAILLFLVISSVSLHNAILPMSAIIAQLLARTIRPGQSPRPDLNLLAVSAICALGWLVLGELADRSVVALFGLSFAAAGMGFLALATIGWWRLLLVPAAAAIAALTLWVAAANLPYSRFFMASWPMVLLAFALPVGWALLRPAWFGTHRSAKIFAPAVLVPLALFIQGVTA
jgi:phytol kinase